MAENQTKEQQNIPEITNLQQTKEVAVDVEYCGYCDFKAQCYELRDVIKKIVPDAKVTCKRGRRGSFEVKINGKLIHSKLSSLALPEYNDVAENVKNIKEGKPLTKVVHQPITDCVIL